MDLFIFRYRQTNRDGGTLSGFAGHEDGASMILDQTASDRQSQADAMCFGGVKWLEDPFKLLRCDPRAGIMNNYLHPVR